MAKLEGPQWPSSSSLHVTDEEVISERRHPPEAVTVVGQGRLRAATLTLLSYLASLMAWGSAVLLWVECQKFTTKGHRRAKNWAH